MSAGFSAGGGGGAIRAGSIGGGGAAAAGWATADALNAAGGAAGDAGRTGGPPAGGAAGTAGAAGTDETTGGAFTGSAGARSSSATDARPPRDEKIPEIEIEAQDGERQDRDASMWIRCPATTKETCSPAYADELSNVSTTRQQKRFIGAPAGECPDI
jgi:hypothetical protein